MGPAPIDRPFMILFWVYILCGVYSLVSEGFLNGVFRFLWTGPGDKMTSQFFQTSSTGGKNQAINVFSLFAWYCWALCWPEGKGESYMQHKKKKKKGFVRPAEKFWSGLGLLVL